MKHKIEVELKPFTVPNFVSVVSGDGTDLPTLPLRDLDSLTLDRLCSEFRNAVFTKAGKKQPPKAGCDCGEHP